MRGGAPSGGAVTARTRTVAVIAETREAFAAGTLPATNDTAWREEQDRIRAEAEEAEAKEKEQAAASN